MRKHCALICCALLFIGRFVNAQQENYIYSREGKPVMYRIQLIIDCLELLNKDRNDPVARSICECQADKLNGHFSNKQYRRHTVYNTIDLSGLIKEDTALERSVKECYTRSGHTMLLQAEASEDRFISYCKKSIRAVTEKTLDEHAITQYCKCQLDMIKTKRISDAELDKLYDPNSLLFYEMSYNCGDPFAGTQVVKNWSRQSESDIQGPESDTLRILTLKGMTYVKLKIGSSLQVWLFDTGASDLLITKEMETALRKEHIITDTAYLGVAEYEMANGAIDSCRRYTINNVQIGKFVVNNVSVAVTEKGKKVIVGKALLNKFSKWMLNNEQETLTLTR